MYGALHCVLGSSCDDAVMMFEGITVLAGVLSSCSGTGLCVDMVRVCSITFKSSDYLQMCMKQIYNTSNFDFT